MAGVTRHIAKVGISFEGLKPPVRVEAGEEIPAKVSDATIKDLLADGVIEVKPEEEKISGR